ncbi:MAG: hypothetical protein IJ159_06355, partial [Prevotella sp.]|nr:hypothetical protein [Prevotella sp.]
YFFEALLSLGLRQQSEQRNTKCCLSEASSLSALKKLSSGLRAQDVFALFLLLRFSFWRQKENEENIR